MTDRNTPYLVRRARLLMGMTREEFAEEFDVVPTTVSRWEHGKLNPPPSVWKRIREIGLHNSGPLSEEMIRASPIMKRVARMEDLKRSCIVSKGLLEEFHISPGELAGEDNMAMVPPSHPQYAISTSRMFDMIKTASNWLTGGVVYVEAHCFAVGLQQWVDVMVTPMPDQDAALIEFVISRKGEGRGFWVHFEYLDPLKEA